MTHSGCAGEYADGGTTAICEHWEVVSAEGGIALTSLEAAFLG